MRTEMLSREFVTAGKAIFTVSNPGGQHYTIRVSKSREREGDPRPPVFFVGLLVGPQNESDYQYLGTLEANGEIRRTRGSKMADDAVGMRVARWALRIIFGRGELPDGYEIRHAGRCGRCARTLTVPESIDSGIGPECAAKMDFAA